MLYEKVGQILKLNFNINFIPKFINFIMSTVTFLNSRSSGSDINLNFGPAGIN